MNQPELYRRINDIQRHCAKQIIDEFADILRGNSNGNDSLLDLGCGTGDVLVDFVYPILPKNFTKIVGVDISPEMVRHSKQTYANYDRVDFKELDIEAERWPLEFEGQFNHVTSFFCLHWIQNHRKALENIFKSLSNGGDCLLAFPGTINAYDAYKTLAPDPRWSEYMKDVDKFIPYFHHNSNVVSEYTNLFEEAGFVDIKVELRDMEFVYEGIDNFKGLLRAVNPFVNRLPINLQELYLAKVRKYWDDFDLCEKMEDRNDFRFINPYTLIVAYAKK